MNITKTKFLLLFLAGFFVILLLLAVLIKPKNINPTGFSVINQQNNQLVGLKNPVVLNFTKPFKLENLVIDVEPITAINISSDPTNTQLTITPAQSWRISAGYTIKILNGTTSAEGEKLNEDFTYQFQTITNP